MQAILGLLAAVPAIISLFREVFEYFKSLSPSNPVNFIQDSADTFKQLRSAKTEKEKLDAAKKIQELISRL